MNIYKASFQGKFKGAIGISQKFNGVQVLAKNEDQALLKLYDDYDHIMFCKFILVKGDQNA